MLLARIRPLRLLIRLVFSVIVMVSMDVGYGQQTDGFPLLFNDPGFPNPPPENTKEMQEAMPELQLFPTQNPDQDLPLSAAPLDSPAF